MAALKKKETKPTTAAFSGEVSTITYKPHEGFADYAVTTLTIKDGVVVEVAHSDPYAAFEALAKLEIKNEAMLEKLRRHYPQGFRHI